MAGLTAGVERLDDDHAAAATGARGGEDALRSVIGGGRLVLGVGGGALGDLQELASLREVLVARATGEETVVADAVGANRTRK